MAVSCKAPQATICHSISRTATWSSSGPCGTTGTTRSPSRSRSWPTTLLQRQAGDRAAVIYLLCLRIRDRNALKVRLLVNQVRDIPFGQAYILFLSHCVLPLEHTFCSFAARTPHARRILALRCVRYAPFYFPAVSVYGTKGLLVVAHAAFLELLDTEQ